MARKPKTLVFDSWAVLAYLEDEPSGQAVADLIAGAHEDRIPIDRKSTRLNSSHIQKSRMPSSA